MEQYSYQNATYQANQHTIVHQYTTFDALDKIVNNKSLRLTRIDLLNDTVENERILELWQKKIFVSCFNQLTSCFKLNCNIVYANIFYYKS